MTQKKEVPLPVVAIAMVFLYALLWGDALFARVDGRPPKRTTFQEPVILQSAGVVVTVDRTTGLPKQYQLNKAVINGTDNKQQVSVIICQLTPRIYTTITIDPELVSATSAQANFVFKCTCNGQPAASFQLKYLLKNQSLFISMEAVEEYPGFQLIEAALPGLASVKEETGPAWLAHAAGGGSVVQLSKAKTGSLPENDFFGKIGYVLPLVIVGTSKMQCVMEVTAMMDGTLASITGEPGKRRAGIGTVQVHRVHGGRSYEMNDGGPRVQGNEQTPNLLVGQTPQCRIDLVGDYDHNGTVDWLDAAKLVQHRMPPVPTHYFDDKFIYLVAGKYKLEKEPRTTFLQTEQLVHDIAMLTDNAPQIPIISGWVYDGQDTGYPSEDSVNATLGGYSGLMHAIAEGKKYNANVTINTNYDDAFKSSRIFDTAFIARRPDGKIWVSKDWAGEVSYITGMAKFMKGWGDKRMNFTVKNFSIKNTLLVDALTWHSIRNDWDQLHPASGYINLTQGRYKVFDGFAKRGLQVMSEQLRYAFIGKQAVSADGTGGGECPFGGEPVPLMAAVYRQAAIWGAGSFSLTETHKNLFWNCRPMPWYKHGTDREAITDYYYLTVLLYNKIHQKNMVAFTTEGSNSIISLQDGYKVKVNLTNQQYTVTAAGVTIAANNATFCPLDDNRIAVYSRTSQALTIDLPKGWQGNDITARALYTDRREQVPVQVNNKKIELEVKAARPVIIYKNGAAAR